mmetsp:Transcript_14581/g.36265  ORF Transcript_14581/g.36265 Transcript_14581/m.36265 type:complete len:401 (-) Transcript_14581:293-1495(-)
MRATRRSNAGAKNWRRRMDSAAALSPSGVSAAVTSIIDPPGLPPDPRDMPRVIERGLKPLDSALASLCQKLKDMEAMVWSGWPATSSIASTGACTSCTAVAMRWMYASPTSANRRAMPLACSSPSSNSSAPDAPAPWDPLMSGPGEPDSDAPSPASSRARRAATEKRGRSPMMAGTSAWMRGIMAGCTAAVSGSTVHHTSSHAASTAAWNTSGSPWLRPCRAACTSGCEGSWEPSGPRAAPSLSASQPPNACSTAGRSRSATPDAVPGACCRQLVRMSMATPMVPRSSCACCRRRSGRTAILNDDTSCGSTVSSSSRHGSAASAAWPCSLDANQATGPPSPHLSAGTCTVSAVRARHSWVRTGGAPFAYFSSSTIRLSLRLLTALSGSSSKSLATLVRSV